MGATTFPPGTTRSAVSTGCMSLGMWTTHAVAIIPTTQKRTSAVPVKNGKAVFMSTAVAGATHTTRLIRFAAVLIQQWETPAVGLLPSTKTHIVANIRSFLVVSLW
eukprot:GHVL01019089.1.p2 GENE.GHVL01019089.1~~GHVL01019089.1.p2  ORF type:complete len:106 (+),score=4.28 GHVL01019089.1:244-561(+)